MISPFKNTLLLIFLFAVNFSIYSQDSTSNYIFVIEQIEIEGNTKSKDVVIYENLPFGVGDTLPESEINAGIEYIKNLEIFSDVTMQPKPGSVPGKLVLKIIVEERYWPHIRFKGGYNELEGWFLTPFSLNFDNIFGLGNFTNLEITLGDRLNALNFNYLNPNIFESDLDFVLKISSRALNFVHYIDSKKWVVEVEQGELFLGFRSRDTFWNHFTFGFDFYQTKADTFGWRYKSDDRLYQFPEPIEKYTGEVIKSSNFNVKFNFDLRDQSRFPANGWWLGGEIDFADKQLGSDYNFSRYILDARKYYNPISKIIFAARVKYGFISYNAPFYEKFYLGGPNSLRGYNDRSLSPVGGGNQLIQAGAEIRFPITSKNYPKHLFTGVLFYDSGGNILSKNLFDFKKIYNSYGFGLRINIPFLGIVRADYGFPVGSTDKKIQFSLGHSF